MSVLNLIWIILYFIFGFKMLFFGVEGVNMGAWDEVFGLVLMLTAAFGLFCFSKGTVSWAAKLRERIGEYLSSRAERRAPEPRRIPPVKPVRTHAEEFDETAGGYSIYDIEVNRPENREPVPAAAKTAVEAGKEVEFDYMKDWDK